MGLDGVSGLGVVGLPGRELDLPTGVANDPGVSPLFLARAQELGRQEFAGQGMTSGHDSAADQAVAAFLSDLARTLGTVVDAQAGEEVS